MYISWTLFNSKISKDCLWTLFGLFFDSVLHLFGPIEGFWTTFGHFLTTLIHILFINIRSFLQRNRNAYILNLFLLVWPLKAKYDLATKRLFLERKFSSDKLSPKCVSSSVLIHSLQLPGPWVCSYLSSTHSQALQSFPICTRVAGVMITWRFLFSAHNGVCHRP